MKTNNLLAIKLLHIFSKMVLRYRKRDILVSVVFVVIIVHSVFQDEVNHYSETSTNNRSLKVILGCHDKNPGESDLAQRGRYWIMYN